MVLAVLLDGFLLSHTTPLQRKTFIIHNSGSWKARWKGRIFSLSRFTLYRGLSTCWTQARWNTERSSVSTTNFQESKRSSEIFHKTVRKDCRHLCNHFTSGPQAFRKILDSRNKLAQGMEKSLVLVLCLYHETAPSNTHRRQHSKGKKEWIKFI